MTASRPYLDTATIPSQSRTGLLVALAFGLAAAFLVAALVHQARLPVSTRGLAALTAAVFLIAAGCAYFLYPPVSQLGRARLAFLGLALLLGLLAARPWSGPDTLAAPPMDATLTYSDGARAPAVPGRVAAWGRQAAGFALHPAYGGVRVPDAVTVALPSAPGRLEILFAKPPDALLGPDGRPRASDGIAVEMTVVQVGGQASTDKFEIPHERFLSDRWVTRTVRGAGGIARVDILVKPRGTPDYDSTLVGFATALPAIDPGRVAKWALVAWAFFCVALYMCVSVPDGRIHRTVRRGRVLVGRHAVPLLVTLVLLGLTWYSARHTSYVFFWDFRNYWSKTEVLQELLLKQAWPEFWHTVIQSYSSEYSMLPAILPAVVGALTGGDTRVAYTTLLSLLYGIPAYLMIIALGQRLVPAESASRARRCVPAVGFLCVLLGLPLFFGTMLWLMPDIGGVVLFAGALLSADSLLRSLRAPTAGNGPALSGDMVRHTLGIAICVSLMFLFRRWFVFASAGIVLTLIGLVGWELWLQRRTPRALALRVLGVFFLGSFVALALLAPVLFDWSRNARGHDYAVLYAGYKDPLSSDLQRLLSFIGSGPLFACMAGAIAGYRAGRNRTLCVLLAASSALACGLFLSLQSPGRHHFYLLMPFLGASLYMLAAALMRRRGTWAGLVLVGLLATGNIAAMGSGWSGNLRQFVFPGYADWLPKKQPHFAGYESIARWLSDPKNAGRACVIASGITINESVFRELWQVIPWIERKAWQQRWISLGQVDTVNGPPSPSVRDCEIALVATPFQRHLRPGEQDSLEILQHELLAGSGIGAAWQRSSPVFDMGDGIEIVPFRRVRPVSDEEYQDLVALFLRTKGPGYVNPMQQ